MAVKWWYFAFYPASQCSTPGQGAFGNAWRHFHFLVEKGHEDRKVVCIWHLLGSSQSMLQDKLEYVDLPLSNTYPGPTSQQDQSWESRRQALRRCKENTLWTRHACPRFLYTKINFSISFSCELLEVPLCILKTQNQAVALHI